MQEVTEIEYTKFHIDSGSAETLEDIADQFEKWAHYYRHMARRGVRLGEHRDGPFFSLVFPSLEVCREFYGENYIPMEFDDDE